MALQTFFQAYAWTDDTKTNLITSKPIMRFQRVYRQMQLSQPYYYELTCMLTDKVASNIGRGSYIEMYVGKTTPSGSYPPSGQTLWFSGYVETITQDVTRDNQYLVTLHSASLYLSHRRNMGALIMNYPTYKNFLDALNGVGTKAGKYGVLSGTGWNVNWIHNQGTTIPGKGDSWRGDWATKLQDLDALMEIYGLYWRERTGSKANSGTIDVGKLLDDSGLAYYGGDALATQIGMSGKRPNAATAQAQNVNIITTASLVQDTTTIYNIVWPLGAGTGDTLVTIAGSDGFKGPPLTSSGQTQYGWQPWQPVPGGQTWYIQSNNKQTWDNQTFALIAEQMNDGTWAYGVVDLTSVNGSQYVAAQGVREYVDDSSVAKKTHDSNVLLSKALGVLATNSKPVDQWTLVTQPSRSANGVPAYPLVGQHLSVNYAGKVFESLDLDTNPASATYGQLIGVGPYTYLQHPNTSDPDLITKASKVIMVEDEFAGKAYTQTITLGKMKLHQRDLLDGLAEDFEKHKHRLGKKHTFTKHQLDHIPFQFSQNPDAWEDQTQSQVTFAPGSSIWSNVPNEQFFTDHHAVEFTVTVNDATQSFELLFHKAVDGTLTTFRPSRAAGVLRLMFNGATFPTSQKRGSGFFSLNTDASMTPQGVIANRRVVDGKGRLLHPGTYRVRVVWSGNKYEAHLARMENGSAVWRHDLFATWHDPAGALAPGAIGFYLAGGNSNAELGDLHAHPHVMKGTSHHGGKEKFSGTLHEQGGGSIISTWDAANAGLPTVAHRHHGTGTAASKSYHIHGPYHLCIATLASVTGSGPYTVTFAAPVAKNSLKPGDIVLDPTSIAVQVKDVTTNASHQVTGFTTNDSAVTGIAVNAPLSWDPLEHDHEPTRGHRRFGIYNPPTSPDDPKAGWAVADRAADAPNDGSADLVIYPDGSMRKGDKPLTQANGAVINIEQLIIGGEHFAKGLEKEGSVLFDAGEYDSTTQQAIPYQANNTAGATITPSTANFYGGGPTQIEASWVDTTQDTFATKGDADSILQLTAGTFSAVVYDTVRWFDTQILTEEKDKNGNQIQKRYTVKKDVTFSIPVYMGVQQTPTTQTLGSVFTFKSFDVATKTMHASLDDGTRAAIVAGDTFVLNPGGANQETFTISSVDQTNKTLILTAVLANVHVAGETIVQKTSHGALVQSYGLLDGTTTLNQVAAAVDAIAVGFYGYTKDASGAKTYAWYRGHWGDPEFATKCPYAAAGTMKYLGALPSANTADFLDLHFKAHQLGLHWGTTGSQAPVTIEGIELAIYSANPGAGVTVYFDAHSQGHSSHKSKTPAGSVHAGHVGKGAVKSKHKHTTHHADTHHHSDFTFWHSPDGMLHWESGALVTQDNKQYTINGGTEDSPNTGLQARIGAQSGANGNWVLFNSSGSSITLKDPLGVNVTIPAYSAGGGPGGQSTGFGFVSENYDFSARVGGGSVKTGLPDGVFKIGKLDHNVDSYTGELPVKTHHASGKKHGKHQRKGSTGHAHLHTNVASKHHYKDVVFSITAGNPATLTWTAGSFVDTNGTTDAVAANGTGISVSASQILYYNTSTKAFAVTNPGGIDFNAHSNLGLQNIGHFSSGVDASGYLSVYGWHGGLHQVGNSQIRNGAVTRGKQHKHTPTRGHFTNCTFQMSGGTGNPLFSIVAHNASGHMYYVRDDAHKVDLGVGSVGVIGAPWPAGPGGAVILFNADATTNTNAFYAVSPTADLTNDGATINGLPASQWVKVGYLSDDVDPITGQYIFHSYHTGTHQNASVHHAPQSHTNTHDHVHKPSKHHHHGTQIECIGTTCYVNWSPGATTPTFTSTLQATDGWSYTLNPATLTSLVAGDWIYVDVTGVANGGTVTPLNHGNASFTPTATQIVLCRISPTQDVDGNYSTEGWHPGAHKVHPHHIKNSAVKSNHIASGAVNGTHIANNSISKAHINGQQIGQGQLSQVAPGVTAFQSGDLLFTPINDTGWHELDWGGAAQPWGSLTGGNLSPWVPWGNDEALEIQLVGANGVAGVMDPLSGASPTPVTGGWLKVHRYHKFLNGVSLTAANVDSNFTHVAPDGSFQIIVARFDSSTDAKANIQMYCNGSTSTACKIRFRLAWAVQT